MPTNKNASFRYRVLDQYFQNRFRQWTISALIEKVAEELDEHYGIKKGVSERQVREDIKIMKSSWPVGFEAPIACKDGCYFYTAPTYSIEKKALNKQDINSLNEALAILRPFKGVPHFQDVQRILAKIEGKVRYNDPSEDVISFEQIDLINGYEFIPVIYSSIRENKTLLIEYQPFQAPSPSIFEVHPYYLKEYRGRWYAFSWVTELNKITNLPLDRIVSINSCASTFRTNTDFDPTIYFHPIVGVTLPDGGKREMIKIKVASVSASYVRSKPIHLTQKEEESTDEHSVFTYNLIPNFEFEAELLRLGEAVEVVKPDEFRVKMKQRLLEALKGYQRQ